MNNFFKKRHLQKTSLKRLWITIIAVLSVFVISISVFSVFFNDVYINYNKSQITQYHNYVSENVSTFNYNLSGLPFQILNNEFVSDIVFSGNTELSTQKKAVNYISSLKIANNGFSTLYIFDLENNCAWSGNAMYRTASDHFVSENAILATIIEQHSQSNKVRTTIHSTVNDSVWFAYKDYRNFLVVLRFPYQEFLKSYTKNYFDNSLKTWFFDNEHNLFMTDGKGADASDYDKAINKAFAFLDKGENSGHFKQNYNFCVYNQSENFICISILPYYTLMLNALKQVSFIWIFILIFLIITGIISYYFSKRFKKMTNYYLAKLNTATSDLVNQKAQSTLLKMFYRNNLSENEKNSVINSVAIQSNSVFKVVIMQIDNFESLQQDNSLEDVRIYETKMNEIAEEAFSSYYSYSSTLINRDTIGIILSSVHFNEDTFLSILESINSEISTYWGVSVTFTYSRSYFDFYEMADIAPDCLKACKLRFLLGYNSRIDMSKYNLASNQTDYPLSLQNKIIKSLNDFKEEDFYSSVAEFKQYIKANYCIMSREWLLLLFTSITKECGFLNLDYINFDEIYRADTLDDAVDIFINVVNDHLSVDNKAEIISKSDIFFKKRVEQLVLLNYRDANYALGHIAAEFNISTPYAGRKIRQLFNCSFSNYLNEQRINVALELLSKTDKKVIDISSFCGFNSVNYFNTVFKKSTKMTPNEYREISKGNGTAT